ncbi:MAG: hypothetical protein XU11_C0032G0016 [Candidatus Dadabacteria bacterium CSP1-2]|nr:MAG: hypothetical protein XU11_C0032G0016 [Candidatus Dadabacteria bacterium CSP1-2]
MIYCTNIAVILPIGLFKMFQLAKNKKSSVIIVRESDGTGGCICCSGGMGEFAKKDHSYGKIRKIAEECGRLHREITDRFRDEEVKIIQIEPRAYFYLMPKVLKDVLKFNSSILSTIRTIFFWYQVPVVIVNGKPIGTGRVPTIGEVIKELEHSKANSVN